MGAGAAGLGALTMLPSASAFNIRTSNPLNYYGDDQNNPNFSVQPDGTLKADSINANNEFTDPNGTKHTGELADSNDVSNIQSSSDVTVTDTSVGTLNDGEILKNNSGTLTGTTINVSSLDSINNIKKIKSGSTTVSGGGQSSRVLDSYSKSSPENTFLINACTDPTKYSSFKISGSQYGVTNPGRESQLEGNVGYKIDAIESENAYDIRMTNMHRDAQKINYVIYEVST
jgi:hypothetical protein